MIILCFIDRKCEFPTIPRLLRQGADRGRRRRYARRMGDVEIKTSWDGDEADHALDVLGLDEDATNERRIYFSEVSVGPDDPLPLNSRGLILRRRVGKGADVTLKLRGPEGCLDLAAWADRVAGWGDAAKLEGDWAGARHLLSASLDRDLNGADANTPPHSAEDVKAVLSDQQRALAREWMVPLDSLDPLGPVAAQRWKRKFDGVREKADVELWRVDQLRFLEVSVRVDRSVAASTQDALTAALATFGLPPDTTPTTKTEAVLRALMNRRG
ncbi:hypothetical protein PHK61_31145 [Actinomycetospora lutea]|uniref:hypothetical protein n=1 Tax=Actinomycetospora lutea TaxID=663604 RepID=UPI0023671CD4|nr:hypothetical protein [Actinomycetospora lutea]MDD7942878.1 hypothetical protein [Actinomycetospora lutea]